MVLVMISLLIANIAVSLLNMNLLIISATSASLVIYLVIFNWKFIKRFYFTFPRDIRAGRALLGAKLYMYRCKKNNSTVPKIFKQIASEYPEKIAFYFREEKWTFREIDELSNRVGNCFSEMGFHPGEEVALMMNTRPEFVGIWLGLAKAGIVTAFINTNQRLDVLVHSITVVNCKAVIFEPQLAKSIQEILPLMKAKNPSMRYYCFGEHISQEFNDIPSQPLHKLLNDSSIEDPINMSKGNLNDKLYYIFTSGTTGLPKAAVIRNHRFIWLGLIIRRLFRFRVNDILYLTLPLYHNNAGTMGTAQGIIFGSSLVLRDKFSASNFWDDCIKYKCTGAMYIGEICRYLLGQPEKPVDRSHSLRIMFGNGLRKKIWNDFKTRFNIKEIGEFYGSTEGNANVANFVCYEGACGFIPCCIPFICKLIYPVIVIKVDPITGEHMRDSRGLCVIAKPGEIGEIVGKIHENDPSRAYPGYASDEATKKKIIHNVFRLGDKAFLSGDLMEMDEYGYLYFRDRTGDTFRWKGENVSTTEVEAVIQKIAKFSDCVVFGVNIECCEGKAGMAVIAAQVNEIDLKQLAKQLKEHLPQYSIPIFIRLTKSIELTGSYKQSKHKVEKEGFNPDIIKDNLYFLDRKTNSYIPLDSALYQQIQSGNILL